MESADYQQRLLLTPFQSLIFCFNDNSEFTCLYHELSETTHNIVIEHKQLEVYSLDLSKSKVTFHDLKRVILHTLLSKEKYNLELPWVGLTRSQKQSITKTQSQKNSHDKPLTPELSKQDDSMLLKALKDCSNFSHNTKKNLKYSLMFEFSIEDPLKLKVWEIKGSDKLQSYISSLNDLLSIKSSVQQKALIKATEHNIAVKSTESEVITTNLKQDGFNVMKENKAKEKESVGVQSDPNLKGGRLSEKQMWSKKGGSNKHTFGKEVVGSWEPSKEKLVTSTPIPCKTIDPQLKTDQGAIQQPSPSEAQVACKICSIQYGKDSALECFICKQNVHYACYKGANGIELSQEYFAVFKQGMPNHKWFCNSCSTMSIESLTKSAIETETDKPRAQLGNVNSVGQVIQNQVMQEMQNAAFETIDHVSAMNHTRELLNDTPKKTYNLSGDIGPMSPITEAEEEKQDDMEYFPRKQNSWSSEILDKIDLLLDQRKEDSKVISDILTYIKVPDKKTDNSYCGKLNSPQPHGPTYGIPEKTVKTTVKPSLTIVISKDVSCSLSKGSNEIKKEFNKLFKDVPIEHCFASKGGSIFIELTNEDEARRVVEGWKTSFFADDHSDSNKGTVCKLLSSIQNSVIIKAVPTEMDEKLIEESIQGTYPGAKVKRFVKAGNVKLRTLKIDFVTPGQSDQMIKKGLRINNLSLRAEKYVPRQRVIQCYHCYKFGHVAKFCHQKEPTCPLCAQNHYQEECHRISQSCSNCASPSHYATNKSCPKFRAVLERITKMNQYQHESQNFVTEFDNDI